MKRTLGAKLFCTKISIVSLMTWWSAYGRPVKGAAQRKCILKSAASDISWSRLRRCSSIGISSTISFMMMNSSSLKSANAKGYQWRRSTTKEKSSTKCGVELIRGKIDFMFKWEVNYWINWCCYCSPPLLNPCHYFSSYFSSSSSSHAWWAAERTLSGTCEISHCRPPITDTTISHDNQPRYLCDISCHG